MRDSPHCGGLVAPAPIGSPNPPTKEAGKKYANVSAAEKDVTVDKKFATPPRDPQARGLHTAGLISPHQQIVDYSRTAVEMLTS